MKKKLLIFLVFFSLLKIFTQDSETSNVNAENIQAEEFQSEKLPILGVWENGGRFIEFTKKIDQTENLNKDVNSIENESLNMKIVLKPYYRFVYEDILTTEILCKKVENSKSQFYLKITYPFVRKSVSLPVCAENNCFFTSYYKKIKYTVNAKNIEAKNNSNQEGVIQGEQEQPKAKTSLEGFWVEQGNRDGILLYPNEIPKTVDAYFFNGDSYLKFRYWLDDIAYSSKKVFVESNDNITYEFPKFLKRGNLVYSCVTNNGSVLRNFETGTFSINQDKNAKNAAIGDGLFISLTPQGAGPGKKAAADTYPHPQFPVMENLPLYLLDDNMIFAIGDPYLLRSKIEDLDEEIKIHNSKRK